MLPLFKSHFSTGRSILTLDSPDKFVDGGPDSIFKLVKDNDLEEVILVEDSSIALMFSLCIIIQWLSSS